MKKIKAPRKHEFILIIISIIISVCFIVFSLKQIKKDRIQAVETSLVTINSSCHEALLQWLNFRKNNIQGISKNVFLAEKTAELLKLEQDPEILLSSPQTSELRTFFQPILEANEDIGVFLIAPNYISIFSMRDVNTGSINLMAEQDRELLDKVLVQGETVLFPPMESDVVLSSRYNKEFRHTMFLVTPIYYRGKIIAAFSLRLDTQRDFSRILEIGIVGESGETIGYDKSSRLVTNSRFESIYKEMGILEEKEQSIATLDLSEFIQNTETGIGSGKNDSTSSKKMFLSESTDCRGEQVYSVHIWDEELNIGIITKIDRNEALGDYLYIRKILIITFLSVYFILLIVMRRIIGLRQKAEDILTESNESLESIVLERTEELQQSIKAKDKFFSILAHDLRSPFSGLLGLFELLVRKQNNLRDDKRNLIIKEIYNSGNQLYKLLDNLLNWSRSQTNNIKLNPEEISLYELIEDNFMLQKQAAENKNIKLLNDIASDQKIYADRNTIDTVFRNLISNAVKFTREGGQIQVVSISKDKSVLIIVKDNGVGISKEHIEKLFRIDEKIVTQGTNNEKGTGLGLVLCREFVELNQGTISVESSVGTGSEFRVELASSLPQAD